MTRPLIIHMDLTSMIYQAPETIIGMTQLLITHMELTFVIYQAPSSTVSMSSTDTEQYRGHVWFSLALSTLWTCLDSSFLSAS